MSFKYETVRYSHQRKWVVASEFIREVALDDAVIE